MAEDIDEMKRVANLSDAQVGKLQVAAKGAVDHSLQGLREQLDKYYDARIKAATEIRAALNCRPAIQNPVHVIKAMCRLTPATVSCLGQFSGRGVPRQHHDLADVDSADKASRLNIGAGSAAIGCATHILPGRERL